METYRDIQNYEGLYKVSDQGNIMNNKGHIMRPGKLKKGYHTITLCKEGKRETFLVHRLVAQAFIPNPNNLPQVNHIDENKDNNSVSNLEWCDMDYNIHYGTALERTHNCCKLPVIMYDLDMNFICFYDSVAATEKDGFIDTRVLACCRGKQRKHKGFIFKFF